MWRILLSLGLMTFTADNEVDAVRFGQLLRGLHGTIHDVTFVYEGNVRPGDGARATVTNGDDISYNFQGRYSYRADGAEFLDFSNQGLKADSPRSHSLYQNLGGLASLTAVPDRNRLSVSPPLPKSKSTDHARPSWVSPPASPHGFFFLWYFGAMTDPKAHRYEFQGWEEVDGHRCLRAYLDFEDAGHPEHRDKLRVWIDLERGGHPLKVDYLREGKIFARSRNIQLQQFKDSNGISAWLPVSGQFETFLWRSSDGKGITYHREPVIVESHKLMSGSVVLNQGLKDTDLTVTSNSTKYTDFKQFKDFKDFQRKPSRALRTDPQGVEGRLEDALADADNKAKRLEASDNRQGIGTWSGLLSVGLSSVGVALLVGAGIWKWKAR